MEFSAFGIGQVAAAVFLGNIMTLVVVKGYQVLDRDEPAGFFKYMAFAVPGLFALAALIGSSGH